jgi:hypothetical protein
MAGARKTGKSAVRRVAFGDREKNNGFPRHLNDYDLSGTMNRRIAWLIIGAFGVGLVWVLYVGIRDAIANGRLMPMLFGWTFALVGAIILLALVFWGIYTLRERIRKRQYRLPAGVTMEMVLRESPYELAHFQGEGDYRVVDKRTGEFVAWKDPDGAEAWVIKQYLKQRRNEQRNSASS